MKYLMFLGLFTSSLTSVCAQNPAAVYHFDAGSLEDSSPNGLHLEALADIVTAEGADDLADGSINLKDNMVFLDDPSQLNLKGQFTLSLWIRQNAQNAEWTALVNKWNATEGSYYLGINPETNRVRWNCFVSNIEDTQALPDDEWVHYVVTYDGLTIKMYRNGSLVNSQIARELERDTEPTFALGWQTNGLPDALHFDGDIDELHVYNVALTASEAEEVYNGSLSSDDSDVVLYDLKLGIQEAPSKVALRGQLLNNSSQALTDVSLDMTIDNTTETVQLSGVTIEPYGTYDFNIPTDYSLEISDDLDVEVTAFLGGNQVDANPENNSRTENVKGFAFLPERKVVIEEGTGTWCGFCPRGTVAMDEMTEKYPDNFIGIAIHNNDPMTVDIYDISAAFSGYPSCNVDRVLLDTPISVNAVEGYISNRLSNENTPSVVVTHNTLYSPFNRRLIVETTVQSAADLAGFYAYGLVITEDGVTGTGPEYDQVNFYSGGALGELAGYENLSDPILAENMVYDHVAREIVGGSYNGVGASLIRELKVGELYSYAHVYVVPEEFNVENLNVISLFHDTETGEIMNAESSGILDGMITGTEELAIESKMNLYPNPSSGVCTLELELDKATELGVTVTDLNGRIVSEQKYGMVTGFQRLELAIDGLMPGLFLVNVSFDGYIVPQKLLIR